MSLIITKSKKPYRKAAIHPNFPYLFDPEPDEGKRFKKHHIPITPRVIGEALLSYFRLLAH